MAANVTSAALGFLFWTADTRLYQPQEVGFAAAVIAAVGLGDDARRPGFDTYFVLRTGCWLQAERYATLTWSRRPVDLTATPGLQDEDR